ncbi:DUF4197 domain-containing protein [Erythrobacter sp. MTPC3]|uniref:DUF4197 domain-containing protein n=1 Tax=Erythrobacter sp. MTPC3 TaxID=3056564 RepID=UPI0036F2F639
MKTRSLELNRRLLLGSFGMAGAIALMPSAARAQGLGLSSILGQATDSALDKLSRPGAFYGDEDIRIALPIVGDVGGGLLGSVLNAGSRLGVLGDVTRSINDAAGIAAGEAKPIFRDAIDDLSFSDAPGIIGESDGGTQYLRQSSNDRLHSRLEPLIDGALEKLGVYTAFDGLAENHSFIRRAGLDRQSINRSVTDQGLDGIFAYIGAEEQGFRKNPLKGLGSLLGN